MHGVLTLTEQAPEVVSSKEGDQAVFSKAPETAAAPGNEAKKPGTAKSEGGER